MTDWATKMVERDEEVFAEAREFGQRFPDLARQDVLEHLWACGLIKKINSESVLANAIMVAYETGDTAAAHDYIGKVFG
jgi:hypothetical protein